MECKEWQWRDHAAGRQSFLRLDNPYANFSRITSKADFSFADGNELSFASDIALRGAVDIDVPAKLGIRRDLSPNPRYNVAVYPTRVELEELGGENAILGSLAGFGRRQPATHVSVDGLASRRPYRLQRVHGRWIPCSPRQTRHRIWGLVIRCVQLVTAKPMFADFDNIRLEQVPEPSAFVLVLVGGGAPFFRA